jgi:hypothetical protein
MNFSTSSRAKKSQAALFAVLVAGSLLAATPVSNAATAVKIGSACAKAAAIAEATNGKTVTCKNKKWTHETNQGNACGLDGDEFKTFTQISKCHDRRKKQCQRNGSRQHADRN